MDIRVSDHPAVDVAGSLRRRIADAIRRRGRANVALSGGSTTPPMLESLARFDGNWRSVHIWQVDERIAPDGDPARNANQLADLVDRGARVHLMPVTEPDLTKAARRYGRRLPDRFDVVHLGIGIDGHTASWPPGRDQVLTSPDPVVVVDTYAGYRRMTLTPSVVNAALGRIVLAIGQSKRPMVERWLDGDTVLPVTALTSNRTVVFVDGGAAPRPSTTT